MSHAKSAEIAPVCETCGYEIRTNRRHEKQSDNECRIVEIDTERVVGWAQRRTRDLYKKAKRNVG